MVSRCVPLSRADHALNLASPDCEGCGGTGLLHGVRCACTLPPRRTFPTLAEAIEACGDDPWRVPGWDGNGWTLGQKRERPLVCPRCGHKHFGWTAICTERCHGPAFGGGA